MEPVSLETCNDETAAIAAAEGYEELLKGLGVDAEITIRRKAEKAGKGNEWATRFWLYLNLAAGAEIPCHLRRRLSSLASSRRDAAPSQPF